MFCTSCGASNPDDIQFCGSCGAPASAAAPLGNAAAAPPPAQAAVPAAPAVAAAPPAIAYVPPTPAPAIAAPAAPQSGPDRIVAGYRVAALGDRLIALILDTILLTGLLAVVGTWAGSHWGGVTATGLDLAGTGAWVTIATMLVVGFIYYWLCEGVAGLTLGKAIAGVRIINDHGAPCGLGPSLIRNILRIIDGLFLYLVGYFIAIFSRLRQRLGDHLSHTFVVEKEPRALFRALFVLLWIVLVAGGFTGAYFVRR